MADKNWWKNPVFLSVSVVLFIVLLLLFVVFLEFNYWWILPAFFYLFYFVFRDYEFQRKDFLKRMKVKSPSEIRIDFWG